MSQGPFDFVAQNGYDNGFFMCFMDPVQCCATCCCPGLVTGWLKGQLDGKSFDFLACLAGPIAIYRIRRRIQELYNHHESEDGSMLAATCCPCCTIVQDSHEFKVRQQSQSTTAQPPAATKEPTIN